MKKTLLLATTATAVAIGGMITTPEKAQAQGLEASINGFYNTMIIGRDQDGSAADGNTIMEGDNPRDYDINSRGRYNINAAYTLDNGITVGFQSQHEIQADMSTDRAYAYLRGGFGQIQLGNHQSVGYQMHTAVGGAGWGIDDSAHTNRIVVPSTAATTIQTMTMGVGAADTYIQPRINYFTPRIAGLQVGVSFTPDNSRGSDGARYVTDEDVLDANGNIKDIITAAINYSNTFGAFDVSASLAGEWGSVDDEGTAPTVTPPGGGAGVVVRPTLTDDHEVFSGGLAVGWGGFEASAAYAWRNMAGLGDRQDAGAALTYSTGPWTIGPSFGWVDDESGGNDTGDEELWIYELGANYAMGPGVNLRGSVMYVDWESDASTISAAAGGGTAATPRSDGDGFGAGVGLALSF